jgi:hypothetical protein
MRSLRAFTFELSFIMIFFTLGFSSVVSAASSSGITYQGRILKPDGTPLVSSTVQFRLQFRTPDNQNCLMYEETQVKDMSNSDGLFAITINDGTGVRTDTSGYTLDAIFSNRNIALSFATSTCVSGSPGTTNWTPNPSDSRVLQVYFKDDTLTSWEPMPPQAINFIPLAIEAKQVGGYQPQNLMRFAESDGTLDNVSPLNNAQYNSLLALLAGTSTQYLSTSSTQGAALPTYASNPGSPSSGSLWYDATLKQVKYFDGSTIKTFGTASGAVGVSSILTGTGLTGGPITASGTISIANSGVDTPQIASSAITDPKIASGTITGDKFDPALTISTTGNITASQVSTTSTSVRSLLLYDPGAPGIHKITLSAPASLPANYSLALPASAPAASQIMQSDALGNLSWTNISAGVTSFLSGSAAAPGWAVTGNTNTGLFSPASNTISLSAGGFEALRAIASASAPTDYIAVTPGGVSSTQISTAGTDANIDLNIAPKGSGSTIFSSGNVGIGTSTAPQALSVVGTMKAEGANIGILTGLELVNNTNSAGAGTGINFKNGAVSIATITQSRGGATNDGNLLFSTKSSVLGTFTEKMRIDSVGNVGIGTTSPNARLDVNGKLILEASVPGSGYAGFAAPASMATSTIWTLPAADGASGTMLSTNGSGILSWAAAAGAPTTFLPGSAAAPGWSVSGNTNTGLFSAASNTISLAAGGKEALRATYVAGAINYASIAAGGASLPVIYGVGGSDSDINISINPKGNGSVGIGVNPPSFLIANSLDVAGAFYTGGQAFIGGNVMINGGSGTGFVWADGLTQMLKDPALSILKFNTNGTERMRIDVGGNIGISASFPSAKLQIGAGISTASGAPLKFTAGTNLATPEAGAVEYDGNYLYITNASGSRQTISTSATAAATSFNAGFAATPGWSVTGNTNTGLFSAASNTLSFATGGKEGLRVNSAAGVNDYIAITPGGVSSTQISAAGTDANVDLNLAPKGSGNTVFAIGNVGIGTTTPGATLDVLGGANISKSGGGVMYDVLSVTNPGGGTTGGADIVFFTGGNVTNGRIGYQMNTSANADFIIQNRFNNSGVENLRVLANGNVGIGTTAPLSRLEIQGGAFTAGPQSASAANGGEIRMRGLAANGSQYVAFRAPDVIAASTIWTLPAADGASGTTLVTNGLGKLLWSLVNAVQLQGFNVASTPPTNGQVLTYNTVGPQWQATDPPGGNVTVLVKAANFAVGVGDANRFFEVTALATVSLPAIATVPSGFRVTIKRVTPSAVTIVGSGAETIDGSNTRVLSTNYASMTVVNTGTEWLIADGGAVAVAGGCVPGQQIFSSAGTYTFTITPAIASNCTLTVSLKGAGGKNAGSGGGTGGGVQFTYTTPSLVSGTLNILVGGTGGTGGSGGFGGGGGGGSASGGGGGGGTSVTFNSTLLAVAGGGGGAGGGAASTGGTGNGTGAGGNGTANSGLGTGGVGGVNNTGGAAGTGTSFNGGAGGSGVDGSVGGNAGGAGGVSNATYSISGGGGGANFGTAGGGGGGGYGGGGGGGGGSGGGGTAWSGGGAGGGYINGGAVLSFSPISGSAQAIDGQVIINWN